jgi:hypothetical protein
LVFPHGGPIVDEKVYLQQATALEGDHLTLPSSMSPYHRPFFTAERPDGSLIWKYTPVWGAGLAASSMLTGSYLPALALSAGAFVVAGASLAAQLGRSRIMAAATAAVFALTPAFLVQNTMYLSYVPVLGLIFGSASMLLAGMRRSNCLLLMGAGLLGGLALWARPLEALIVLGPIGAHGLLAVRSKLPRWKIAALVSVGAAPPMVGFLVVNAIVLDSPFALTFTEVAPDDRFGFGLRRDVPEVQLFRYGAGEAIAALRSGLAEVMRWNLGGILGVALGLWGLATARRARGVLVSLLLAAPVAYIFFWGSWNAAVRLHAYHLAGPFYYLPTIAALALGMADLCARVWERVASWRRPGVATGIAALAMASAVGVSATTLAPRENSLRAHRHTAAAYDAALAEVSSNEPSLVLSPEVSLIDRYNTFNSVPPSGNTVYALRRATDWVLLDQHRGRVIYDLQERIVLDPKAGADLTDPVGFRRDLVADRQEIVTGDEITVEATIVNATGRPVVGAYVHHRGKSEEWILDRDSSAGEEYRLTYRFTPSAVTVNGRRGVTSDAPSAENGTVAYGAFISPIAGRDHEAALWYEHRAMFDWGPQLRMLAPGVPWVRWYYQEEVVSLSDVSTVLRVGTIAG